MYSAFVSLLISVILSIAVAETTLSASTLGSVGGIGLLPPEDGVYLSLGISVD